MSSYRDARSRLAGSPGSATLLDLFCGVGGWSKAFLPLGWRCVGVDIADLGYPGEMLRCDVRELEPSFVDSFDAVVVSPPCEEFARAWLPWLRCDKTPAPEAVSLLRWSVNLCDRPSRIVECSKFAARHVPGAALFGSYALWGDVPALMPKLPKSKERKSGLRPELRAEIPMELSSWIARYFTRRVLMSPNEKEVSDSRSDGAAPAQAGDVTARRLFDSTDLLGRGSEFRGGSPYRNGLPNEINSDDEKNGVQASKEDILFGQGAGVIERLQQHHDHESDK